MIIIREKIKSDLAESRNSAEVLLLDFIKLVGKKRVCQVSWELKSDVEITAGPAYCGFPTSYFFRLDAIKGYLSVDIKIRSIVRIMKDNLNAHGIYGDYTLHFKDGSVMYLNIM